MTRMLTFGGVLCVILSFLISCTGRESSAGAPSTQPSSLKETNVKNEQATFAAGCFWGVQASLDKIPGVLKTTVGYTGGKTENPTYGDVCSHGTGHAEAVLVEFDPSKVSYAELLDAFWSLHDPTTVDRQGPDIGDQYRSAIFYHSPEQEKIAKSSVKEIDDSKVFKRKIVTQIVPAVKFYNAEDYHQEYFSKQGTAATCHVGIADVHTKLASEAAAARKASASPTTKAVVCNIDDPEACGVGHWKEMTDAEMKAKLSPEQYAIARNAGTEQAFTGKYWDEHRPGVYKCAVCGQELFDAKTKFESGTGWPSFYEPVNKTAVTEKTDATHGMSRTEVLCSRCQSHLGHVFDDGPKPSGKRYCMNSAVMDLAVNAKPSTAPSK